MGALKIMPVFGLLLFAIGIYFVASDKAALGAAMLAIGAAQFAMFFALRAAAAKRVSETGGEA